MQAQEMLYLVEIEFIGPNRPSKGRNAHKVRAQREMPRTNMSGEGREVGYLGTTDDWYKCAHGQHTPEEAIMYIHGRWGIALGGIKHGDEVYIPDNARPGNSRPGSDVCAGYMQLARPGDDCAAMCVECGAAFDLAWFGVVSDGVTASLYGPLCDICATSE